MSKKCQKCGCIISDDAVTGYCFNCSRITPPQAGRKTADDIKDGVYDNLIGEEKVLAVTSVILIILGVLSSITILFVMSSKWEAFIIAGSTVLSSLLIGGFLLCIVEISRNIRVIKSKIKGD